MKANCQVGQVETGHKPSSSTTKPPSKTTRKTTRKTTIVSHDEGQYDDDENAVDDSTFSSTTTTMRSTTRKRRKKTKTTTTTTTSAPTGDSSNEIEHDDEEDEVVKPSTTRKPTKKPSRKPVKPPSLDPVDSGGDFKVVCYFTNWAWYRPGAGKYLPDDIDIDLCTHIVYGFAVLDSETLTIKTHDSWADIDNKFYTRVSGLKTKGIKVTLALGGWNDSLGDKYSKLVRDANARRRFVKHSVEFVEKYGFQGLDLDWEYPVCWQVDCKKGHADEKEGFASLVEELAVAFRPRGLLLSSAVSPSKMVIDAGYDIPSLAVNFDWIAVMTYDFHGHWDKKTGHVAPLYEHPQDENKYFNGNFSINYWIEKGCPPSKLVMGVPMYGQSFGLSDQSQHGLNAKSYGPGDAGQFTRAGGFLAFYEICTKINSGGWTVVRDAEGRMGPYAYKGAQWVSYDDIEDVKRKAQYMRDMKLGGGMIWALDLDDFRGTCGCGKYPLLKMLNAGLGRGTTSRTTDCT